jgi:hypothetical protein
MVKYVLIIACVVLFLANDCLAQENLLEKVPQLQEVARQATGGAKGCGRGTFTLITSTGEIKVSSSLDPIHVFGKTIRVSDLLVLLKARADSNRTGETNPMSGEVSQLTYVVLLILSSAQQRDTIPVIAELLTDKDDTIRAWSAIALYRLAQSNDNLKMEIEKIQFPKLAVQSAKGRSVEPPEWLQIADGGI